MDDYGAFEYKKPASEKEQDYRTSYYRAHRYLTDARLGNRINTKTNDKDNYVRDPLLYKKLESEYGESYNWKYLSSDETRNPSLKMKHNFIKPFEESRLRFIPCKMKPQMSVSNESYGWKEPLPEIIPPRIHMPEPVVGTKLEIHRGKPGYTKYLDPTATTMNLSYVHYTPKEIMGGIAAPDNITFWNWDKIAPKGKRVVRDADPSLCDDFPAKDCPKRRNEFQNPLKSVPNSGLTTEVRDNYLSPKFRSDYLEYDTTDVSLPVVHTPLIPFAKNSEYSIIGSGEPVLKYV